MAVFVGNAAAFKIGTNTVAEMDAWTIDAQTGMEKTHAFGDTWEENTSTIKSWTGSGSGRFDPSDTNGQAAIITALLAGTTVAGRWYYDSDSYFSGSAFVQGSISASENGMVTVSYNLTGTGALSHTA